MRHIRNQYRAEWFEVFDEEGRRVRRFNTMEEAEHFAEDYETIVKTVVTREAYVPEEAPF